MERWKINRAGLINFWYYDEEILDFMDGRMILRGSNGSGKSVTMQSFIPLLLDGNKSPERLDPFGSKARKMENYLLGENEEIEERTGYLFIEFAKEHANHFITIGMGFRARRGQKLDSWGFSITDGRRIGIDFYLYKQMGEKIPLTKKQIENRIGSGGMVCSTQKEYMQMVNKLLFGFDTIEDYDELIKLLIQIRTPKLSKEFKPTVIYDIMSNSLQTLSDEDLRPMSEAIENMDAIKSQLEILETAKKAADRLKNVYDQYNQFILGEKARDYINASNALSNLEKKEKQLHEDKVNYEHQHEDASKKVQELKLSQNLLEEKRNKLQQQDAFRLKKELDELEKEIINLEENKKRKQEKIDEKKDKERELHYQLKETREKIDTTKKEVLDLLEEMSSCAENFMFDEQEFLKDEIQKNIDKPYDFKYVKTQIQEYSSRIQKAIRIFDDEKQKNRDYNNLLQNLEESKKKREQGNRKLEEGENLFEETKEEYIEKLYSWEKENQFLRIPKETLIHTADVIKQYGEKRNYDDILHLIREAYNTLEGEMIQVLSEVTANKNQNEKALQEKEKEILQWKNKQDPEPQREEKVQKNRARLLEAKIPFTPLYKVIDFKEEVSEEFRGILEEALLDMGLLDAVIISPKYKAKVMEMDISMADRYIFAKPNYLQYELSHLLKIEQTQGGASLPEEIDNVLKSILMDVNENIPYINKNGEYGLGILRGKVSRNYSPKYIGIQARKRYREEIIAKLNKEKNDLIQIIDDMKSEIQKLQDHRQSLREEFKKFPPKQDLEAAYSHFMQMDMEYQVAKREVENKEKEAEKAYEILKEVRSRLREITEKIQLPSSLEAYEQAAREITNYQNDLITLQTKHEKILGQMKEADLLNNQKEDIVLDLDDLLYDFSRLEQNLKQRTQQQSNIHEQLKMTNYEEIKEEIDHCIKELNNLPPRIEEEVIKATKAKNEIEHINQNREELQEKLELQRSLQKIYKEGFEEEYGLGYVEEAEEIKDVSLAKRIYEAYKGLFLGGKQREDYSGKLQDRFHGSLSDLVEYNLTMNNIFEVFDEEGNSKEIVLAKRSKKRLDLMARIHGKEIKFLKLVEILTTLIEEQKNLLKESDRQLFEDILANTISKKIRAKIYHSERWVKKMNDLMESMNTSSGLSFSLNWKNKKAETEEQLDTKELVDLLKTDASVLKEEDFAKLSQHFRSKIDEARKKVEEVGKTQTFHSIIKEVLDYRKWFEFQLFYTKTGERKRELTNHAFFTFSGGEKAMAMYVPLFSSVYAKYEGAKKDCPRIISLDEAFAGVDENNIKDMFRLMVELDLSFIINSQILWGDYETVPSLFINELLRINNEKFVTVIRYTWNGKVKELYTDSLDEGDHQNDEQSDRAVH